MTDSKNGSAYWFAYSIDKKGLDARARGKNIKPKIRNTLHMLRDAAGLVYLNELLNKADYKIKEIIPNLADYYDVPVDHTSFSQFHLSGNDLLVQTTRPPLDDNPDNQARIVFKSNNAIEHEIIDAHKSVFYHCDRRAIILCDKVVEKMYSEKNNRYQDENYRGAAFYVHGENLIMALGNVPQEKWAALISSTAYRVGSERRGSIGYIVFFPQITCCMSEKKVSFKCLSIFSISGTASLLFTKLCLRNNDIQQRIIEVINSNEPRIIAVRFDILFSNDNRPLTIPDAFVTNNYIKVDVGFDY